MRNALFSAPSNLTPAAASNEPPLMESDWFDLVDGLLEIISADEMWEWVKWSGRQTQASEGMA